VQISKLPSDTTGEEEIQAEQSNLHLKIQRIDEAYVSDCESSTLVLPDIDVSNQLLPPKCVEGVTSPVQCGSTLISEILMLSPEHFQPSTPKVTITVRKIVSPPDSLPAAGEVIAADDTFQNSSESALLPSSPQLSEVSRK